MVKSIPPKTSFSRSQHFRPKSNKLQPGNAPSPSCQVSKPVTIDLETKRDDKISIGLRWYNEAQHRGFVRLPKFDREKRALISDGLDELYENELLPIIKDFNPDLLDAEDEEIKWRAFEGAYEEIIHRLRIHIAIILNLDPSKIYYKKKNKKWFNKIDDSIIALQHQYRSLRKLKDDIDFLNSDETTDSRTTDKIRNRVSGNISIISSKDRIELFGTDDAFTIVNELSNLENADNCSRWLSNKIGELIKTEMNIKTAERQAKRIQESYSDYPKKTLDNFVFNKPKTNCSIDEQTLFRHFSESFKLDIDEFPPPPPDIEGGIFALTQCFKDSDKEDFMNCLKSDDIISEVIKSRKFNSATGPDGIDYSVFKLSVDKATSLFLHH